MISKFTTEKKEKRKKRKKSSCDRAMPQALDAPSLADNEAATCDAADTDADDDADNDVFIDVEVYERNRTECRSRPIRLEVLEIEDR